MAPTLPAAVRKQVDEANRIAEEMANATQQQDPPADAAPQLPQPPADAAPQEQPPAEVDGGDGSWEQRYRVLQGKYNAEVPRLNKRTKELEGAVEQLQSTLSQLSSIRESAPAPANLPAELQASSLLKPEEVQDYGTDFVDFIRRAALDAVKPHLSQLVGTQEQLKSVLGNVHKTTQLSAREKLYTLLDDAVENWREVNKSEAFVEWLDSADPYAGVKRQVLLDSAFNANDAKRVIAFFKGFLQENAVVNAAPGDGQPSGKVSLDTLVAPGKSSSTGTAVASDDKGRVWRESEIGQFYADVQKGKYRAKPDEYKRIERDIQAAVREGRVQLGR